LAHFTTTQQGITTNILNSAARGQGVRNGLRMADENTHISSALVEKEKEV